MVICILLKVYNKNFVFRHFGHEVIAPMHYKRPKLKPDLWGSSKNGFGGLRELLSFGNFLNFFSANCET
jgi:hypothetical protein